MHTTTHTRRTQVVVRARAVHRGVCSLAVVHGWSHTNHAMCVCGVRRAICLCVSVGGEGWGARGERAHKGGQRGWWVWWARRALSHTPACVPPQCAAVRGATTHTHTHAHTADRAGQRTQWWWLVGMAHSGGGSHTTHTATTTTCPPPCVCVCGWGSGQHQHSQ